MLPSMYSKSMDIHHDGVHQLLQFCILQNEYEHCIEDSDNRTVQFGGLQQYVNKLQQNNCQSVAGQDEACLFYYLPDHILEEIFLHLNPKELHSVRQVCKLWKAIVDDNIFWRRKLQKDLHLWSSIGHDCNPTIFDIHCASALSARQIYQLCDPKIPRNSVIYTPSLVPTLKNILSFMLNIQRKPRLAMLGPGLDKDSYHFSEKLIMDEALFTQTGMFPGLSNGMGSGFTYRFYTSNGLEYFDLVTVHSRGNEVMSSENRLTLSRLFSRSANGVLELTGPAIAFCLSLDGLIYVVDSNCSIENLNEARQELYALTQQFWAKPRVPILVISLASQANGPRKHSCYDVVRWMHLNELNGIWRIYNVGVDDRCDIKDAFTWVIQQCKSNP